MAHLNPDSPFQSWVLTEKEFTEGSKLTITQKQVIQNRITMYVQERLNLDLDPTNPMEFTQREASIKGAVEALSSLLTQSTQAEQSAVSHLTSSGE